MEHLVCQGETLDFIANRYGTTTEKLRKINGLADNYLSPGSKITVRQDADDADEYGFYYVKKYENWQTVASKFKTSEAGLKQLNPKTKELSENQRIRVRFTHLEQLPYARPYRRAFAQFYCAQAGESLSTIAKKFGLEKEELLAINELPSDFAIFGGCKLRVSRVLFKKDKTAVPPDFYPAVFENFSFDNLLFHTLSRSETLEQAAKKYRLGKERLLELNFLKPDASGFPGMKLWVKGQILNDAARSGEIFYTCQRNDTAHSVAAQFGLTRNELLKINSLPSNFEPYTGFEFRVRPVGKSGLRLKTLYHSKEPLRSFAARFGIDFEELLKINGLRATPKNGDVLFLTPKFRSYHTDTELHIVKQGETLSLLCQQKRANAEEVLLLNRLKNNTINTSQWLFFPKLPPPPVPAEWIPVAQEMLASRPFIVAKEGQKHIGLHLKSAVGVTNSKIDAEDLSKIQARLVELNLLPQGVEQAEEIAKSIGNQPITSHQIPITLEAIREFQRRYLKATKWPFELQEAQSGVIRPQDQTDFMLRELRHYHLPSGTIIWGWGNNLRHESRREIGYLKSGIFGNLLWEMLEAAMPGRLDSLSTSPLRYGILGFKGSELALLLAKMKTQAPVEFKMCFQNIGLDVEIEKQGEKIISATPRFYDISMKRGIFEVFDFEDLDIYALNAFVEAASIPALAMQQIYLALEKVVAPALQLSIELEIGEKSFKNQSIMELLSCQLGACALMDFAAHCGLKATAAAFKQAFTSLASTYKLRNPLQIRLLETREILRHIHNSGTDEVLRKRAKQLFENHNFSDKKDISTLKVDTIGNNRREK